MSSYRHFLFLINPAAGNRKRDWLKFLESKKPDNYRFEYLVWQKVKQRDELIDTMYKSDAEVFVAIGGDGTINLVGGQAMKLDKKLGIIPAGSGNGLSRHLNIPMNIEAAFSSLIQKDGKAIDVGFFNGKHFFCTAGIGFDALIGKQFADRSQKGLLGYVQKTIKEVLTYKPEEYELVINGETLKKRAFLITFANASQYGNNAIIAPTAIINDGLLNVCILKPFPLYKSIALGIRLFTKTINASTLLETFQVDQIQVQRLPGPVHLDGEPFEMDGNLSIWIKKEALEIIC